MSIAKKVFWIFLYLAALAPLGLAIVYLSENDFILGLIFFLFTMSIYTGIVIKNLKFLSLLSYITLFPVSMLLISAAIKQTNNVFVNTLDERYYMIVLPLLFLFILINSLYLANTKKGLLKTVSLIIITLSVLILTILPISPPVYYQNFVYTRVYILVLLVFSILLIIQRKKILGILGVFLSIGILLLSAWTFAGITYTLESSDRDEVVSYVDPLIKEMFDYYNNEDYLNFHKYCGSRLRSMLEKNPISELREKTGTYEYFGETGSVTRKAGSFYVEYPVKFQRINDLMYLTVVIENIDAEPSIDGLAFSDNEADK